MQIIPQPIDYDEKKEQKKLEYHWRIAETKVSIQRPESSLQQITNQQRFSNKAKRSIIVKQIQMTLAKSNYDLHAPLRSGYILKRSEKGVYWVYRYCVIDSQDFKMYEQEDSQIVSILPLKQITQITPMQDRQRNKQQEYGLMITVSNWVKRSLEKNSRTFYFAFESDDELEEWAIYLEFAKAKAIYNDFVDNFGKISFPINLNHDAFDTQLTMELTQQLRKMKIGHMAEQLQIQNRTVHRVSRQSKLFSSTSILGGKRSVLESSSPPVSARQNQSLQMSRKGFYDEKSEYLMMKDYLKDFIYKSLLLLWIHLVTHSEEQETLRLGQSNKFMKKNIRFFFGFFY